MSGRFAPSPTGDLHLGNLRTALAAWLLARSSGRGFLVRFEDLDRVTSSPEHERGQLRDLAALGLDHDPPTVRQSERFDRYHEVIDRLRERDLVYPCYCTRREIAAEIEAATSAPHGPGHARPSDRHVDRDVESDDDRDDHQDVDPDVDEVMVPDGAYPGTCRELTRSQRAARAAEGRPPAWRLRAEGAVVEVVDRLHGRVRGLVDDVVVRRGDGVPAYNLAVVVDDAAQGITQVVRGDDLLGSTPRQVHLQRLLGYDTPEYVHVPLVLGPDGQRLAKRHGAVTLTELVAAGRTPERVLR